MTTPTTLPPPPSPLSDPPRVTRPRTGPLPVSGLLWRIFAGVFVVSGLVWGTLNAITVLAHEERVETETFATADVDSLVVDSEHGAVRITAAETSEVRVVAEISDGLRSTGESRRLDDGVLTLRATCPNVGSDFCWVDYEITVPRDLPITVESDGGRIEVTGSDADLQLDGDNGSIVLADVSGTLAVATDNGSVVGTGLRSRDVVADSDNGRVDLTFVDPPSAVRATSDNGRVEVVVPDDGTTYRADLRTDNGDETLEVPTDPSARASLYLETDNGSVTARTG